LDSHSALPKVTDSPERKKQHLLERGTRLLPYFGVLKGTWLLVGIGAIVGALTGPMIPALLKELLDRGFQKGALDIWMVPAALLSLFAIRGLAGYVAQIGLTKITGHGLVLLRQKMFDKVLYARLHLFSQQSASSLSNTLVYEVQNGAGLLVNSVLSLVRNSLESIALIGYLFYLNWKLTFIVAAVFPIVAAVMRALTRRVHTITKTNQTATDALAYVVEENVLAHRDVRLYAGQINQASRFEMLSESLRKLAMKSTVAGAAMTPLTQMVAAIALSAVISVALMQSANSGTSVGGFVAFVTAMLQLIAPIRQLSEVASPITRGLVALERAIDLIDEAPDETSGTYSKSRASGHIVFYQVQVQYPDAKVPAIKSLSLEIHPGESIAFVGASGSGKTTLLNLLPRFVDCTQGHISLDDIDLTQWNLRSLRSQFSIVSQHVVMLNDSVAANVALGLPIDYAKIQHCLQAANLSGFLKDLPQGMETIVGHNASQLSGGQRQRLAIARALYKDAPILILDEATSALDTESERAVQEALQVLMQNRTTLIIAHRLSTVMHANRIVVLEAGTIVESGNHAELLANNAVYARLYRLGQETSTGIS
jgi:ATP-binding cassette, subfamily B, bacterial MsbA